MLQRHTQRHRLLARMETFLGRHVLGVAPVILRQEVGTNIAATGLGTY